MAKLNPFKKTFSTGKIGTGRFFTAGKLSGRNKAGLGGALRNLKGAGSYTKNLSKQDLAKFQELIGDEMKKLSTHSSGLSYQARARIMQKADKMAKSGDISYEDKKDLRKIVEALSPNGQLMASNKSDQPKPQSKPQSKQRAVSFFDKQPEEPLSPEVQNKIRAGIKVDVAREMEAKDSSKSVLTYRSGSALGRYEEPDSKKSTPPGFSTKGQKVDLPNMDNLSDLDIG